MPEFVVKTTQDRNLFIEADSYDNNHNPDIYEFRAGGVLVASVNAIATLAIIKEENNKGDFYFHDDLTEDHTDDVCNDCREAEAETETEFERFYNFVWDIIDDWHSPEIDEPKGPEVTQ